MDVNDISTISAVSAFIVSILSIIITLIVNLNQIKTETITKNRVEWINSVRILIMNFIDVYIDESIEQAKKIKKLKLIKYKISLYLKSNENNSHDNSYRELVNSLDGCIQNINDNGISYDDSLCNQIIEKSQDVFSKVWKRSKIESGISEKEDQRIDKIVNKS